ncbi:hypothetical protein [Nocardia sp. NPDC058114]|uniref:hypothetical protein n=1 Tax=Nocardia sp. NPDC058114 TaxID=3346346 RepID=UPI0036DB885A
MQPLGWGLPAERFTWSPVELGSDRIQTRRVMDGENARQQITQIIDTVQVPDCPIVLSTRSFRETALLSVSHEFALIPVKVWGFCGAFPSSPQDITTASDAGDEATADRLRAELSKAVEQFDDQSASGGK